MPAFALATHALVGRGRAYCSRRKSHCLEEQANILNELHLN